MRLTIASTRRTAMFVIACLSAWGAVGSSARAQSAYPNKPVHIVVPFSAGGAVDTVGRTVGEKLAAQLGQPVIVDNKPGASANLGAELVARAAPDGYTLLVAANGLATNVSLFRKLPFDTLKDLAPIALLGNAPLVLVVPAASPLHSLKELLATGRADKTALTYGSVGNGSSGHLAGALLESEGHVQALHVAYKGGAPALVDLLAGRISFMLLNPLEVATHVKSGRLRALAVSGTTRLPMLPDVPTMAEAGVANMVMAAWYGVLAPTGTPAEVIGKLNAAIGRAVRDPAVRKQLEASGAETIDETPAYFAKFLADDIARWRPVIKAAAIKPE